MNIQIRKIAVEDAKSVASLSEQLGYPLPIAEITERIKEISSREDHISFIALENEIIVGWIHAFKSVLLESRAFVEIGGLVVDENFRGKGIGKKLVQSVQQWSTEKKINEIRVRSHVKRKGAHQFYTIIGFTEIKEQKVFEMIL